MHGRHIAWVGMLLIAGSAWADGLVRAPIKYQAKPYAGSLEETAQEAILIFHPGDGAESATQDLILKISVEGEVDQFGWVVPLCNAPTSTGKEDAKLFEELHQYVQKRLAARAPSKGVDGLAEKNAAEAVPTAEVEVIERKIVGSYDVAIVRENKSGALNRWLEQNGYATISDGDDVIDFYREQGMVFACVKVSQAALEKGKAIDLHPLRFTFDTGGRDGMFFPMRLTGLQDKPFDVNLYVFYDKWLNDDLSVYGYTHRGFKLKWRDYDSRTCKPNAGKLWSSPRKDPYLASYADDMPTVTAMFKRLHPGKRYYLTNIQAHDMKPDKVRRWPGDLWLFPYYTNRKFVPYDAREGGPAAVAYE